MMLAVLRGSRPRQINAPLADLSTSSMLAVGGTLALPALTLNLDLLDNAGANGQGSLGSGTYQIVITPVSLLVPIKSDITIRTNYPSAKPRQFEGLAEVAFFGQYPS